MKISKAIKAALSCVAITTVSSAAFATPTYSGLNTIQSVIAFRSGIVLIVIGSAPVSPWSACNGNQQFAINTASASGEALYRNAITAQQNGKGVYVVGTGTCTLKSSAEDVEYIQINP
jgi:hypothetical protein